MRRVDLSFFYFMTHEYSKLTKLYGNCISSTNIDFVMIPVDVIIHLKIY